MTFFVVLTSLIISLIVFVLNNHFRWGAIRASCAVTLASLIDLELLNLLYPIDVDYFITVVFGASFIGMSSLERFNMLDMAWAAFIYGMLFIYFLPLLEGMGGGLGLSAFISVVIVHLIKEIKRNMTNLIKR